MSGKRLATTDLNHENWDQDDPSEHEEIGSFKPAPKDVLEKRVIRTAKRRAQIPNDERSVSAPKSVFSGFGGFNKAPPSSFDFLANLTNGNKNSPSASKSDTMVTSTIFNNVPISSNTSNGIFGIPVSSESKPTFKLGSAQSSPFGSPSNTTTSTPAVSLFTASKADSTVNDSPFKMQSTLGSSSDKVESKENKTPGVSTSQVSSTMFGGVTTNSSSKLFTGSPTTSPFSIKPSATPTAQANPGSLFSSTTSVISDKPTEKPDDKKITYCAKLKGLNESVSDWIKKHVEETPFCLLTPIFKDYEKYLKEIQDEYQGDSKQTEVKPVKSQSPFLQNKTSLPQSTAMTGFTLGSSVGNSEKKTDESKSEAPKLAGFTIPTMPTATTAATSSPFSTTTNTNTNGTAAPFSFGIAKPFSFNNVQPTANTEAKTNDNNDDADSPPKVEYKPIVEENSVYQQKCKVFVKTGDNFADKGVGTLYIKKIEESAKHQLLIRANTNLGNVLVNLILASVIPTQRMEKNHVMMVCIPTPDSKPPPVPILIRVKTSEEADELLETLNKYKT